VGRRPLNARVMVQTIVRCLYLTNDVIPYVLSACAYLFTAIRPTQRNLPDIPMKMLIVMETYTAVIRASTNTNYTYK